MAAEVFEGMTDEEIAALDEEAVKAKIDFRCAEEGIPLHVDPAPPVPELIPPDVTLYTLPALLFTDRSHAEQVRAFASDRSVVGKKYDWTHGSSIYYVAEANPIRVSEDEVFSLEAYNQRRDEITKQAQQKEAYDKAKKYADDVARQRAAVREPIMERIAKAQATVNYKQRLQIEFARYLELAKGDHDIALAFLKKAYTDIPDGWEPQEPKLEEERN